MEFELEKSQQTSGSLSAGNLKVQVDINVKVNVSEEIEKLEQLEKTVTEALRLLRGLES